MIITVVELQHEVRIQGLKTTIAYHANQRENARVEMMKKLKELADLVGMEVCGEALVEKSAS